MICGAARLDSHTQRSGYAIPPRAVEAADTTGREEEEEGGGAAAAMPTTAGRPAEEEARGGVDGDGARKDAEADATAETTTGRVKEVYRSSSMRASRDSICLGRAAGTRRRGGGEAVAHRCCASLIFTEGLCFTTITIYVLFIQMKCVGFFTMFWYTRE
jgi:hypothetical protein